ncbi:MAG: hypothetical protein ACTSXO_01555 [Candidatus Heimdallarchaeota archaeon]|nr:MAG: hypothetical protein DRO63_07470 [Candidatus Gerdarchaeota archaeon]RLI71014.1 MAG: hypothetical protein DRP02_06110 [Candidatus Gerdarchaeota archaeon]
MPSQQKNEEQAMLNETYLQYYLQKYSMWQSILLSMFVLLDIIPLFLIRNFSFVEIFYYFIILLILLTIGIDILIWFDGNALRAIVIAVITGVMPTIELAIFLAQNNQTGTNLALAIISLLLAISQMILPILVVIQKTNKLRNKKEN